MSVAVDVKVLVAVGVNVGNMRLMVREGRSLRLALSELAIL